MILPIINLLGEKWIVKMHFTDRCGWLCVMVFCLTWVKTAHFFCFILAFVPFYVTSDRLAKSHLLMSLLFIKWLWLTSMPVFGLMLLPLNWYIREALFSSNALMKSMKFYLIFPFLLVSLPQKESIGFCKHGRRNWSMALLYMNKYISQFGRINIESTLWFDVKASNGNLLSS